MHRMAILSILSLAACATDEADDPFEFGQNKPVADGKGDGTCGDDSCEAQLCGYDCTTQGQQCSRSCAAGDGRATSFVAGTASGATSGAFDSRHNPYVPQFSLDNVLIYGCELWDFGHGRHDGLEIQYEELIHASVTTNAQDPTRTGINFGLYTAPFTGPGSYRAEAMYQASHDAPRFAQQDACTLDVDADGSGGLTGSFDCTIRSEEGGKVSVKGTFGCAENAMKPIFSEWATAPR